MKPILILGVTLCVLAATMASLATQRKIHRFVGLWEAVGPNDGFHQILSMTDNEDGTVKLLRYDIFFTLCDGNRGIAQGAGEPQGQRSLKADDYTITRFAPHKTTTVPITYARNPDGALFRVGAGPPSSITYHRTSK